MGKVLVVLVDNQGTVGVYRKGHGKGCPYATCLVRAAYVVAKGMAIGLRVEKIRRCSDGGSVLADAISKGDIDVLRRAWPKETRINKQFYVPNFHTRLYSMTRIGRLSSL